MNITAKQVQRLMDHVGGPEVLSRLLGIDYRAKGQPQRVSNWRRRGLPIGLTLAHYEVLKRLRRQVGL